MSSLGMGIEVIPVSGLSAKKPPSELSKCRMIKPPMCKAFRKAPPSTVPCTCSLFPGPTLSTLEPLVTIGSWCHQWAGTPPDQLSSPVPLPGVCLSVCSDGELAGRAGRQLCISCRARALWFLTKH